MSILALHRDNKNQYRKYPFKKGAALVSSQKITLPNDLIVNCSITSVYGKHRIYIRQISKYQDELSIVIASYFTRETLGVFYGSVTSDFTVLSFRSFYNYIDGNMTIGSSTSANNITEVLHFDKDAAELEESVIFCHTPPAVKSISDKNNTKLSGDVFFGQLVNVNKYKENNTLKFATTYPEGVINLADYSSYLNNCPTPVIKSINGVPPSPVGTGNPENDGNIYIVGVDPIVFYGIPEINSSSSQLTIGLGEKVLTTAANLVFKPNQTVYIYSSAQPSKYMQANVVEYNNTQLTVSVVSAQGVGETYSSWSIRTSWPGVVKTETTNITLTSLCSQKQKSLPPLKVHGFTSEQQLNKYYSKIALESVGANPNDLLYPLARPARLAGNFNSALRPEFIYWPQFVQVEYYDFWPSP
jgi:hypothetical protein